MSDGKVLIRFRKNRKEGFFDKVSGKVVIPPIFDGVRPFSEGRAFFYDYGSSQWGVMDEDGNEIVPPRFMFAEDFSEGVAAVCDAHSNMWGFIEPDGTFLIRPVFRDAHSFSEGLAPVVEHERWGYLSKANRIEIDCMFYEANRFSDGLAWVWLEHENYFIKKHGMKAISMVGYNIADSFSEGLAPLFDMNNRYYVFIDTTSKIAINGLRYLHVSGFHEGRAAVSAIDMRMVKNKGFIDKSGNVVIPCVYDSVDNFSGGICLVAKEGRYGFIDRDGNIGVPIAYSDALNCGSGVAAVVHRGRTRYFNEKGEEIELAE